MNYGLVKVPKQDNLISKLRVLSIDDNHQNLDLIQQALEEHFDVISSTGDEPVAELVVDCEPHIILLDIMLVNKSGYDICRFLRDQGLLKNTVIIFISSLSSLDDKLRAYEAGGDDYICKPVNLAELTYKLEAYEKRINEHRKLQRQMRSASQSTSLQQSNQLLLVIEFLNQSVEINTLEHLSLTASELFDQLQLSCVMEFRTGQSTHQFPLNNLSQLESEILDLGKRAKREVSFGKNILFNTKQCSLLIKQMPEQATELEHTRAMLGIILATLSSRIRSIEKSLTHERAIKAMQLNIDKIFYQLSKELLELESPLHQQIDSSEGTDKTNANIQNLLNTRKDKITQIINQSTDIDISESGTPKKPL